MSAPAPAAAPVRLSILVVTWNSATVIDACLESALAQTRSDVEAIVLDNASSDGSPERAAAWFARGLRGTLLREERNLGFCGGMNRAFAHAKGDLVLFLNPDAVLPPDFAAKAIALADARSPEVGIFAPRILRPDGRLDSAGLIVDRFRRGWDRGGGEAAEGRFDREEEVFGCTGAAALLRRAMLEDVADGPAVLDERIFAYCDDVDLAWRARLRGWGCLYEPSLVAVHGRAGRNGLRADAGQPRRAFEQTLMVRNRLLVLLKCERARDLLLSAPLLIAFELARIAFLAWRVPRVLRAYPQLVRMLPAILRDRRRVQGGRREGARPAWVAEPRLRSAT